MNIIILKQKTYDLSHGDYDRKNKFVKRYKLFIDFLQAFKLGA